MPDLIPFPAPALSPALAAVAAQARDYIKDAKAASTLRAYGGDWRHFVGWCEQHQLAHLPASPETVGLYVTVLAETHKVATLQRRLSAISVAHQAAGHESPTKHIAVRTVMAGIRRHKGTAQQGKAPLLTPGLKQLVAALPEGRLGLRDRALLLLVVDHYDADGYRRFSFARAFLLVKRHWTVALTAFRSASQAAVLACTSSADAIRVDKHWRWSTANSHSAMLSHEPCLGV